MSTTLAALFDDYTQAQNACSWLQAAGIQKTSMRLNGHDPQSAPAPAPSRSGRNDGPGSIKRLFMDLFGMDDMDDEAGASNEPRDVQHGGTVLTVVVTDEQRIDELSDILTQCGAVDVHNRHRQLSGVAPTRPMDADDDSNPPRTRDHLRAPSWTGRNGCVQVHRSTTPRRTDAQQDAPLRRDKRAQLSHIAGG